MYVTQFDVNISSSIKQQMKPINMLVGVTSIIALAETTPVWVSSGGVWPSSSLMLACTIFAFFLSAAFSAQTFKPSPHVWSKLVSPGRPHLSSQDPPLPQQLGPALLVPQIHSENQITFRVLKCLENKFNRSVGHHLPNIIILLQNMITKVPDSYHKG